VKKKDLSYLDPSGEDAAGVLTIEALSSLSMSTSVPGTYTPTHTTPPKRQILGMLENALGLHFGGDVRKDLASDFDRDAIRFSGADSTKQYDGNENCLLAGLIELEIRDDASCETHTDLKWRHKFRTDDSDTVQKSAETHDAQMKRSDGTESYGYGRTLSDRERAVAESEWTFEVSGPLETLERISEALDDPAGPLYLGDTEGWVTADLHLPS
jgi:hypothetical protein